MSEKLTVKQKEAIISAYPWVIHDHTADEQCEAMKGSAPLKAYWDPKTYEALPENHPERIKHRCKFAARWVFLDQFGRLHHYCYTHLIYRGLYGGMDEEARTMAWDNAHPEVIEALKRSAAEKTPV